MLFLLHVVVVAVHRFQIGLERLADGLARRDDHRLHHQGAVLPGEVLRPADGFHIVVEVPAAFLEIGQVAVRQVGQVLAHVGLGQFDELGADGIADPARAAVQHEPDAVGLVQADLDEVVAGAQGAEVVAIVGLLQPWVLGGDGPEACGQGAPGLVGGGRYVVPGALVAPAEGLAVGHGALDGAAQAMEVVRQVGGPQGGEGGDHAAADVHAHGGGNDRADGGNHAADGRALAQVHVGHDRQVLEDEGHLRRVDQLLAGFLFHRHAFGPETDGLAAGHFQQLRAVRFHLRCLMKGG
ncbi:hypothetical protein FQZ97_713500 [compost metagenome]